MWDKKDIQGNKKQATKYKCVEWKSSSAGGNAGAAASESPLPSAQQKSGMQKSWCISLKMSIEDRLEWVRGKEARTSRKWVGGLGWGPVSVCWHWQEWAPELVRGGRLLVPAAAAAVRMRLWLWLPGAAAGVIVCIRGGGGVLVPSLATGIVAAAATAGALSCIHTGRL